MRTKGTTLIDVLIGSALILIFFLGVFGLYKLGLKVSFQSQHRIIAAAIANEYIEKARNLSYIDVGVEGKYPTGYFKALEAVIRNGVSYNVEVSVRYIADSADGIGFPEDICPNDYKQIVVSVGWEGSFPGEIVMSTNIAPLNEIQECATIGGILNVNVFDPIGGNVANATILIDDINTHFSDSCITGIDGSCQLILPISPSGMEENYFISVSKEGWNSARTFGTGEEYNGSIIISPLIPHATIFSGEVLEISFSIGIISAFNIHAKSFQDPSIFLPFTNIGIRGSKIVGNDAQEEPIFKYNKIHTTDQNGNIFLPNLEWDNYVFWAPGLIMREPKDSVNLSPGITQDLSLYIDADHSLIVTVIDSSDMQPVFSALVRVFRIGVDKTIFTDSDGKAFFIPLEEVTYEIEVSAEGYDSFSGEIIVVGSTTKDIHLQLNPN